MSFTQAEVQEILNLVLHDWKAGKEFPAKELEEGQEGEHLLQRLKRHYWTSFLDSCNHDEYVLLSFEYSFETGKELKVSRLAPVQCWEWAKRLSATIAVAESGEKLPIADISSQVRKLQVEEALNRGVCRIWRCEYLSDFHTLWIKFLLVEVTEEILKDRSLVRGHYKRECKSFLLRTGREVVFSCLNEIMGKEDVRVKLLGCLHDFAENLRTKSLIGAEEEQNMKQRCNEIKRRKLS